MAPVETIQVEVMHCTRPHACDSVTLVLPAGTTVAQAVAASGLQQRHGWSAEGLRVGVWTHLREPDHVLRDRDRVEVYRPLKVDPKEARRQRYQQHKASVAARAVNKSKSKG